MDIHLRFTLTVVFTVTIQLHFQAYSIPRSSFDQNEVDENVTGLFNQPIFSDIFATKQILQKLLTARKNTDRAKVLTSVSVDRLQATAAINAPDSMIPSALRAAAQLISYDSVTSHILLTLKKGPSGFYTFRYPQGPYTDVTIRRMYSEKDDTETLVLSPPEDVIDDTKLANNSKKTFVVLKRNPQNCTEYRALYAYVIRKDRNSDEERVEWDTWEERGSFNYRFTEKLLSCRVSNLMSCNSLSMHDLPTHTSTPLGTFTQPGREKRSTLGETLVQPEFDYYVDLRDDYIEARMIGRIVDFLTTRPNNSAPPEGSDHSRTNHSSNLNLSNHEDKSISDKSTPNTYENSLPQDIQTVTARAARAAVEPEPEPISGLAFPTNPINMPPLYSTPVFSSYRRKRSGSVFQSTNHYHESVKPNLIDPTDYVINFLSAGLFEDHGWMTRSGIIRVHNKLPNVSKMFVSFSNCPVDTDPVYITARSTIKDIISFHVNEMGISCKTNEVKKLLNDSACFAKLFVLFRGQTCIALKMNQQCIYLNKSVLSIENEARVLKLFELAMFSQAICARKADGLQFHTDVSESIKIIEHVVLNGFSRAESTDHFIKLTRSLIKTAKTVFIKVLQDVVRYNSCEKCPRTDTANAIQDARALLELILFCIESNPFTVNFQALQNYRDVHFQRISNTMKYYIEPLETL